MLLLLVLLLILLLLVLLSDVAAAGFAVDPAGHTFVLASVPFVAASHVGDRRAGPDSAAGAGALVAVDLFISSHGAGAGIAGSVVLARGGLRKFQRRSAYRKWVWL